MNIISRNKQVWAVALMTTVLWSCGDDSSSGGVSATTVDLTATENAQVQTQVNTALAAARAEGGFSLGKVATTLKSTRALENKVSNTYACPKGGEITYEGVFNVDPSSNTSTSAKGSYEFKSTFSACKFEYTDGTDTKSFELTSGSITDKGKYDITYSTGETTSFSGSYSYTSQGGFDIVTPDKNGTCGIDISFNVDYGTNPITYDRKGTFCGKDISQEDQI